MKFEIFTFHLTCTLLRLSCVSSKRDGHVAGVSLALLVLVRTPQRRHHRRALVRVCLVSPICGGSLRKNVKLNINYGKIVN